MKTLSVFSVAHAFALMMPICFFLLYRGGRKKLKRYWRLSKEGPFFKLGVWVVGKMGEAAAAIDRALLGSRLVGDPTKCRPKFTVIKTQSDRMILSWTAPRSSAWVDDVYELQTLQTHPAAAKGVIARETWEELYSGSECTFDYQDLPADTTFKFRLRTVNAKGPSEWAVASFDTRQVPVDNGGSGPNYRWQQTTSHVRLCIDCRDEMQPRDLYVECSASKLRVYDRGLAGGEHLLLEGDFTAGVKADEAAWALAGDKQTGGQQVVVVAEKQKPTVSKADHWRSAIKGHALLDPRTLPKFKITGDLKL